MDVAIKLEAINQLQLVLNASHHAVLWPRVEEEKSAISHPQFGHLITQMHRVFPLCSTLADLLQSWIQGKQQVGHR